MNRRLAFSATTLAIAGLLSACSPKNSVANVAAGEGLELSAAAAPSEASVSEAPRIIAEPQTDRVRIQRSTAAVGSPYAHTQLVTCKDEDACNPSVGMLLSAKPTKNPREFETYRCTVSLIGEDIVLTNSHCLGPLFKDPKPAAGDCSMMEVHFPSSSRYAYATSQCTEVLYDSGVSQDKTKERGPDVAILRIRDKGLRPAFGISSKGFGNNEEFSVFRVTPTMNPQGLPTGTLEAEKCKAVKNSFILPGYTETHSQVVALADCPFVKGNSGSPIVDEFGRVRGVGQAILTYPEVEKNFPNSLQAPLTSFIQATNLGCVAAVAGQIIAPATAQLTPAGFESTPAGESCKAWDTQPAVAQLTLLESTVRTWRDMTFPIYSVEAMTWVNSAANTTWRNSFAWSVTTLNAFDAVQFVPVPKCVMPGIDVSTLPSSLEAPSRLLKLNFAPDLTYIPEEVTSSKSLHIDLKLEKVGDAYLLSYTYASVNKVETVKFPLQTCGGPETAPVNP